jgi:flagellar protein FlaI
MDQPTQTGGMEDGALALTEALLERLRGRMNLIQPPAERRAFVADTLTQLLADHQGNGFPALATEGERQGFIERFLERFLAYDIIEEFLADPLVEDIVINSTNPIFVHRTGEGLTKTERRFATARELDCFIRKLVVFGGHSEVDPINDLELANIRGRVNIVQSPFGPQITIARGKAQPFTILQLIETGMLSPELAAQLWLYVEGLCVRPANILISGGPGAGKTTLLNALLSFIPWKDRLVIIEDTLELNTAFLENCSRLESCRRVKTPELVKNSLRMRPERILVGEVRGVEANDLMTTMNLGKYCMGTLHASTARETVLRLQNEPMNVPPVLVSLIDVLVILRKMNTAGQIRRVVSELVESAGMEKEVVLLSPVWNYDHQRSQTVECSPSSVYRDKLALESGRSPREIIEETARRAEVLARMQASGRFPDIASVTCFCQRYSDDPAAAMAELGMKDGALGRPQK